MSPLEKKILRRGISNSIHIRVLVYYPAPISEKRRMSRLAYKIMRKQLNRKDAPHPPKKRGPKPRGERG